MVHLALDCPYCDTEHVGFSGDAFMLSDLQLDQWLLLLRCGVCGEGVVAKYHDRDGAFPQWVHSDGLSGTPELLKIRPQASRPTAPDGLPSNIEKFYLQAEDGFRRKSDDAAGTMFRKCLDVALKRIHPSGKGTLQQRIRDLPDSLGVTPAMKEWADEIRELGNDAAHEEEPFTREEATVLQKFTYVFLLYTFTLPAMLEERRQAKAGGAPSSKAT